MFVKSTENFLEAFEKSFSLKNEEEIKLKIGLEYSDKTPFFGLKLFFQMHLENFLLTLRTCSKYLKGPLNLALCVSKKIVIIRHTNKKILAKNRKKNRFCMTSLGTTVDTSNLVKTCCLFLGKT